MGSTGPRRMGERRPRSNMWFLLPALMAIIGGVIAYFVLRHDDPGKARNCLYLGVALTVIYMVMDYMMSNLA